jgi:hypothetical protein
VDHLSPIARNVVVAKLIPVEAVIATVVGLALPPRRREEALFTLAPAAHARRVAWVVDAAQIAFDLAAAAWDAGLVDAFVLRGLGIGHRLLLELLGAGPVGGCTVSSQGVLRRRCRHGERGALLMLSVIRSPASGCGGLGWRRLVAEE